ncbi:MAG: DUF2110 family protein [Candidatus Bathyarchaeia archaeon]
MPITTLAIKIYSQGDIKLVEDFLKSKLKGLRVKTQICGTNLNNWVQASISGEDENVALRYISEDVGTCPNTVEEIKKFSEMKGYIASINKDEIMLDIGVSQPDLKVKLELQHLQAQLVDGRKVALKKLAELYGFCEGLPLIIKVLSVNEKENSVEATLSERQLDMYSKWIKSLLDRLIVLGATREEITLGLKVTKCTRDVVEIEPLGLFEHAVTCKLGTSAVGLIPKLGKRLQEAILAIFSPKEIIGFLGENQIL